MPDVAFWFRLALALHTPVATLKKSITAMELAMWKKFAKGHPLTDERFDHHFEGLRSDILFCHQVKYPDDYLIPPWKRVKKVVVQSYGDIKGRLMAWAKAHNEKAKKNEVLNDNGRNRK